MCYFGVWLSGMKYLLVLFFAIVCEIDASCPNGTFSNDAGNRCYFIPKDSTQFLLAGTSCQNQNGNLASISDSFENAYLQGKNYGWISLRHCCCCAQNAPRFMQRCSMWLVLSVPEIHFFNPYFFGTTHKSVQICENL